MKKIIILAISFYLFTSCFDKEENPPLLSSNLKPTIINGYKAKDVIISTKFTDNNTLEIICKGFPLKGSTNLQKKLTMQKNAQLNAIYFAKEILNDSVDPTKDGHIERIEVNENYITITYIIKKQNLINNKK